MRSILLLCSVSIAHSFVPLVRSTIFSHSFDLSLQSTLAPVASPPQQDDPPKLPKSRGAISMPVDELAKFLGGRCRAEMVWDCYSIGIDAVDFFGSVISLGFDDFESINSLLPSSRRWQTLGGETLERLAQLYPNGGKVEGGIASLSHTSRSRDGTTKLLLRLSDGLEVETVIIPWNGVRSTLCISSQVICRQGCASEKIGKFRSLTSDELLAQMFFAKKICRWDGLPEIYNVVFLGEPVDNSEAVISAAKILTSRELFQLSASDVTISTAAPNPDSFHQLSKAPCVLAWRVHAANDALRKTIVPTTKYSMTELRQGFIDALQSRSANLRTALLEVVLMRNINDSLEQADELGEFARVIVDSVPGCNLIVNLIPYNDIGHELYMKSREKSTLAFQKRLLTYGVYVQIRKNHGDDESVAYGQLATRKKKVTIKKTPLEETNSLKP